MEIIGFVAQAQAVPFREEGQDWCGWNCWGLIRQAYRALKGLDLPDFQRLAALKYSQAAPQFASFRARFREIPRGRELPLDILLFSGRPVHAALVVAKNLMLHVEPGLQTCVEPFTQAPWPGRLLGIYRYVGLEVP